MAFLMRQLARMAARKIANDPVVREKATQAARKVAGEARQIAREEDKARAAGRAFRRFLNSLEDDSR